MPDSGSRDAGREAARAVAAASAQLDLAMREAGGPVEQLGSDIERMQAAVEALRASPSTAQSPQIEVLQAQLTSAIQQLQFYDRMFQHLTHVHDYLMAVAGRLGAVAEDADMDVTAGAGHAPWEHLRARFYARLLTEPQRQLFDLMLPPATGSCPPMRERAALGSIELF